MVLSASLVIDPIAYGYAPAYEIEYRSGEKFPGEFLGWINLVDFRNQLNGRVVQDTQMVRIYSFDGRDFFGTGLHMSIDSILWEERVGDVLYPMVLHHETTGEVITIQRRGGYSDVIGR